jgi:hypothetical protein
MLITGDLTITSAASVVTPANLGVKKFISVLGNCQSSDAGKIASPVLADDGSELTVSIAGAAVDIWPVALYPRLSFLAV